MLKKPRSIYVNFINNKKINGSKMVLLNNKNIKEVTPIKGGMVASQGQGGRLIEREQSGEVAMC